MDVLVVLPRSAEELRLAGTDTGEIPNLDRCAPSFPALARSGSDGARAGHESEEAAQVRQCRPGALEAPFTRFHRAALLPAFRQGVAGRHHINGGTRAHRAREEGRAAGGETAAPGNVMQAQG